MNARIARVEGNVTFLDPPPSRRTLDQMFDDVDRAIARDEALRAAYRAGLRKQRAPDADEFAAKRELVCWCFAGMVALATLALVLSRLPA